LRYNRKTKAIAIKSAIKKTPLIDYGFSLK